MTSHFSLIKNMKTCFKCLVEKAESEFYKHPQMKDGLLGKCKDCTKSDTAKRAAEKRDVILAYDHTRAKLPHRVAARAEYNRSHAGRASHREALIRQIDLHPEKYYARTAVGNAVRDGRLIKEPCLVCGSLKVEAHHSDYSRPLDVRWLCNAHHRQQHKS